MKTTQKEFWEILSKSRNWVLEDGCIRSKNQLNQVCPICYVANKKLKKKKHRIGYWQAAEEIGLNFKFTNKILVAADEMVGNQCYCPKLRKKLLKFCKLDGKNPPTQSKYLGFIDCLIKEEDAKVLAEIDKALNN